MKKDDSVWLVGASSGIGAALASRLLKEGHRVVLSARREEALRDVARTAGQDTATRAFIEPCDVTRRESIRDAYRATREHVGIPDVVISNAGAYEPMDSTALDVDLCRMILDVNLYGAVELTTAVLPDLLQRGSGRLVAVASVAGYRGLPRAAAYCGSKAGLIAFMESVRFDIEPRGVKVTVVNPGFVKTRLTEKNDFKMPGLIGAEKAADYIYRGLRRGKKEIHFPPSFSRMMKLLRVLPYPMFEALVRRMSNHG
jgi:short-subunit dehydrogenase